MKIEWSKDLELNHPKIDAQHQELYRRINSLFEACMAGKGSQAVTETLQFLEGYVVEHFSCEEGLMLQAAYPKYIAHQSLHAGFIKSFAKLKEELGDQKPGIDMVVKVNQMVVQWLNYHICNVDREFAGFIRNGGK